MKVKGKVKFSFGQALKVLLCSIFKVEMDVEIEADVTPILGYDVKPFLYCRHGVERDKKCYKCAESK